MTKSERTPAERRLQAQVAVNTSWANTRDRAARTAAAREAADARFEREVDPDGTMDPRARALAAASARKAFYARLTAASLASRRQPQDSSGTAG